MRSPEWSERKSRANEPERCREHATKECITTRDGKRKDKRDGPKEAPARDGGRKSEENCGKETLRRIGSLNHLGERKLGVCFPNIIPPSRHPSWGILGSSIINSTCWASRIACVYTCTCRVRASGETQGNRIRTRVAGLFFRSRIDRFSLFLKTRSSLVFAIYRLPRSYPLFPARPACPCLHLEEVEQPASTSTLIFSSLSVRTTCAGIHGCTIS